MLVELCLRFGFGLDLGPESFRLRDGVWWRDPI